MITISVNPRALAATGRGPGWYYDSIPHRCSRRRGLGWEDYVSFSRVIYINGPGNNYTLTGSNTDGVSVIVPTTMNGTLTLDNLTLVGAKYHNAIDIIADRDFTLRVKNHVTLSNDSEDGWSAISFSSCPYSSSRSTFILNLAAGATLDATGGPDDFGIYAHKAAALIIKGSGTLNARGGDFTRHSDHIRAFPIGIRSDNALLVKGSVSVTAQGGDYKGGFDDHRGGSGVCCGSLLTLTGTAKLTAIGGSALVPGCFGGDGITIIRGYSGDSGIRIVNNSTAPAALTAIGGVGHTVFDSLGDGIWAHLDKETLIVKGTGETRATGGHGIAVRSNLIINAGKITAEGQGAAGYGLFACGCWNRTTEDWSGGTVTLTGGTVAAYNETCAAATGDKHAYWKTLTQTGGTLTQTKPADGTGIGGGSSGGGAAITRLVRWILSLFGGGHTGGGEGNTGNGGGNTGGGGPSGGGEGGGGGGGGGAPTPFALARVIE